MFIIIFNIFLVILMFIPIYWCYLFIKGNYPSKQLVRGYIIVYGGIIIFSVTIGLLYILLTSTM